MSDTNRLVHVFATSLGCVACTAGGPRRLKYEEKYRDGRTHILSALRRMKMKTRRAAAAGPSRDAPK